MRNPVKSMSGNMWAALRKLRRHGGFEAHDRPCRTLNALVSRGLAYNDVGGVQGYWISPAGELVADAYAEGQEAKA